MDDPVAIKKCKAGDKDAFRYLVERYQIEAMGHALAILADREDALDAVQEAFLDAYQALGKFDMSRQFYPWFYTILRNRCFKLLVRRRKNVGLSLDDASILAPVSEAYWEDQLALEHALLVLSPAERELLTLKHLDGLSYDELAERLQIPRGTVMSRLFYARKRLREKLALQSFRRS
ncbi:MAG TPA: sigma-70 family RNA polymerase sigma factor [Pyrinomonadaceae bacterium]|nr:sigma-70 family RNA polymerase sigma factor [Pyrinomonadaceae bacterium]